MTGTTCQKFSPVILLVKSPVMVITSPSCRVRGGGVFFLGMSCIRGALVNTQPLTLKQNAGANRKNKIKWWNFAVGGVRYHTKIRKTWSHSNPLLLGGNLGVHVVDFLVRVSRRGFSSTI